MRLKDWVDLQAKGGKPRRKILEDLAEKSGVSFVTLEATARGARMGNYPKAKQISRATDWKVSIVDLCDETPEETTRAIVDNYHV